MVEGEAQVMSFSEGPALYGVSQEPTIIFLETHFFLFRLSALTSFAPPTLPDACYLLLVVQYSIVFSSSSYPLPDVNTVLLECVGKLQRLHTVS